MHQAPHVVLLVSRTRRLSDNQGFTLVEVTAAAFVLLFAIASSIVAMQMGFRSLDYARGLTIASQLLQSEIEDVRMWPVEDVAEAAGLGPEDPENKNGFLIQRTITELSSAFPRLYDITLTIEWRTTDQILHRRSTSTRYCENGLNDFFGTDPKRAL